MFAFASSLCVSATMPGAGTDKGGVAEDFEGFVVEHAREASAPTTPGGTGIGKGKPRRDASTETLVTVLTELCVAGPEWTSLQNYLGIAADTEVEAILFMPQRDIEAAAEAVQIPKGDTTAKLTPAQRSRVYAQVGRIRQLFAPPAAVAPAPPPQSVIVQHPEDDENK